MNSADVVFAVDGSGSMGPTDFQLQLDIVEQVISGLNVGRQVRVGLLTYGTEVNVIYNLEAFLTKSEVLNAMSVYYTGGTTNTAAAINTAANQMFQTNQGDRRGAPNILVLLTDGMSNDRTATVEAAVNARTRTETPIQIVVIGVGKGVNEEELRSVASDPVSRNVVTASDWTDLRRMANDITSGICNCESLNISKYK